MFDVHLFSILLTFYVFQKRLQLKHGKDRTAFYRKELSGLKRDHALIGQSAESFEEWSKLEGAVRNNRHLELRPTGFENLLHDGLVTSQIGKDRELAKQFFEEASAIDPDNYLSLPSRMISMISFVVILAFIEGTFRGEVAIFSGIKAKVRPSFHDLLPNIYAFLQT